MPSWGIACDCPPEGAGRGIHWDEARQVGMVQAVLPYRSESEGWPQSSG